MVSLELHVVGQHPHETVQCVFTYPTDGLPEAEITGAWMWLLLRKWWMHFRGGLVHTRCNAHSQMAGNEDASPRASFHCARVHADGGRTTKNPQNDVGASAVVAMERGVGGVVGANQTTRMMKRSLAIILTACLGAVHANTTRCRVEGGAPSHRALLLLCVHMSSITYVHHIVHHIIHCIVCLLTATWYSDLPTFSPHPCPISIPITHRMAVQSVAMIRYSIAQPITGNLNWAAARMYQLRPHSTQPVRSLRIPLHM